MVSSENTFGNCNYLKDDVMNIMNMERVTVSNLPLDVIRTIRRILPELSGFSLFHEHRVLRAAHFYFEEDSPLHNCGEYWEIFDFDLDSETGKKLATIASVVCYTLNLHEHDKDE
jgi:hypothetical protein